MAPRIIKPTAKKWEDDGSEEESKQEGRKRRPSQGTKRRPPPSSSSSASVSAAPSDSSPSDTESVSDGSDAPRTTRKSGAKSKPAKSKARVTKPSSEGPLASPEATQRHRTLADSSGLWIGAHVSAAGGLEIAVTRSNRMGGRAFALFMKNHRRWESPPLAKKTAEEFKRRCEDTGIDPMLQVLPHGSYLINLCSSDEKQREKSYGSFLDELQRCESCGIGHYNMHPGSTGGSPREEGIKNLAKMINRGIAATKFVCVVIENMSGQKNIVGSSFKDLRDIIELIDDKSRIGVCLDTCHLYAAGYDIRTDTSYDAVMKDFDDVVGFSNLKAMHLNGSKGNFKSAVDKHDFISGGQPGLTPFKRIVNDPRFRRMPNKSEEGKKEIAAA